MNLGKEIVKLILEEQPKIKKIVGIYGGRFQPFGPHHLKTYKWLDKQVDEAYITTSNIKKPPRHPMNYKEKVRHMSKMGVPKNRIIEEKSPYVAKNLAKKYDEETTAFVYVFGAKDAGRLGGGGKYFQDYKKNKKNLKGHIHHGYYLVAPHVSISIGGSEVSGTSMRTLLGSPKIDDSDRAKLFKKMFGYIDKGIFAMMTNKFKKLFEASSSGGVGGFFRPIKITRKLKKKYKDGEGMELIKGQMKENVSSGQLAQVEKYLDKLWDKVGIDVEFTRHFMDRVNDRRNQKPINSAEVIRIFKQTYKKYGKQISKLGKGAQALMKDMTTDVNIPFVLHWNGTELELRAKTIMRKKNFKSSNKKFAVEAFAVKGSKVEKFITGKNLKLKGKKWKEIDFETIKIDNRTGMVTLKVLSPKKLFGMITPVTFKTLRRGPFLKTDTSKKIKEGVDLPIEIGDTIKMGRFKNKKVVIKSIEWNEKGDLVINGRTALKFRLVKEMVIKHLKNVIKEVSSNSGYGADAGEPETGYISPGKKRMIGKGRNAQPDNWYDRGGYEQLWYPVADNPYGDEENQRTAKIKVFNPDIYTDSIESDDFITTGVGEKGENFVQDLEHNYINDSKFSKNWWKKIFEASFSDGSSGGVPSDDGPSYAYGNFRSYKKRNDNMAARIGFEIVDYIIPDRHKRSKKYREYPNGPVQTVSYAPSGDGTGKTANNQIDLKGSAIWKAYKGHIGQVANRVGYEVVDYFFGLDNDVISRVKTDSTKTLKQGDSEAPKDTKKKKKNAQHKDMETVKEIYSVDWWKDIFYEIECKIGQQPDRDGCTAKSGKTGSGKKDNSWMKGKDGWEILDSKNVEVAKTKEYSEEAAKDETGEYFQNKKTLKAVPNLAKDEDDLTQKILDAKEETFSSEEIQNIRNCDAGEVLDASEEGGINGMKKKGKALAKKYKKGWDYITKNIESGEPQEAPIVIRDKNGELYLMAGNTRMMSNTAYGRKIPLKVIEYDGNFKDSKNESLDENLVTNKMLQPRRKELLLMGGAYGHMAHPFDDKNLKFSDLKKIIELGLGGNLSREDNVSEKLDGQNIMISWKDGKLIAARNKGHIKNGGKTALGISGIKSKFKGRGNIADAFNFAMTDLSKAIKGLSQKQKDKIFNNGYNFMNMEVMWPKSSNVIDYDVATLIFHGALKYDDNGNVKGEVKGSGRMLAGMIKQINQHIQKKYSIGKPHFLQVPKHQDFGKLKSKFSSRLTKLQKQYGLKDSDTLGMYHQSYWEEYIYNGAKQFGFTIKNTPLKNLTKRWAFFDKSYKVRDIKKDFDNHPEFLEWVLKTDKENHAKMVKDNMKPFEELFFEVGATIMKNMSGFIAANPDKAVQGVKNKLDAAIKDVQSGGDLKKLNKLTAQLDKLNKIGGTKSIVPSEGIVFKYNGNTYKFTGAFAPINQITGLMSF